MYFWVSCFFVFDFWFSSVLAITMMKFWSYGNACLCYILRDFNFLLGKVMNMHDVYDSE